MIALTRAINPAIVRCELTHVAREPIDLERVRAEHTAYERALSELGCDVQRLDATGEMPDSVFIEDTAVVFDELAIVARPGAPSRRLEIPAVERVLASYRTIVRIEPPATLDGGDVLVVGRAVYVGQSSRTNAGAAEQMHRTLAPFDYVVTPAPVRGCLHLKSAVSAVGEDLLLINRRWADVDLFAGLDLVDVDPSEPWAANALRVGNRVIYPEAHLRTAARLEARGVSLTRVPAGELAKAEGGVTCCCLLIRT